MNDLLDDDDRSLPHGERELTLSTGAILGIFLVLVLLCGACFGVGYNMGRKSSPVPLALNDGSSETMADANGAPKPAAGSPLDPSLTASTPTPATAVPAPKPAPIVRKPPPVPTPAPEPTDATDNHTEAAAEAPIVRPVAPSALLPNAGTPSSAPAGSIVVQVAAVSHQEDADLLVGALRGRGYVVSARPAASDGFIHVQVGPFATKKDAEAMRQRLLSDGYNAMLKY